MIYFGIDPGISGGIARLDRGVLTVVPFEHTENAIAILEDAREMMCAAVIEQVGAMPGQGVTSMFTFGENFGWWQGILQGYGIPFSRVRPQAWQKALGVNRKGMEKAEGKRLLKRLAIELFPGVKITNATADAALLAEYCRRMRTN